MIWVLLVVGALAQDYRFPTSQADEAHWYPTAYRDHAGEDWNCGSIRYTGHRGADFGGGSFAGMADGRDVVAAASGIVSAVSDGHFDECTTADCAGGGGFGNYVKVKHPDGWNTYYAHLKKFSIPVSIGDFVACGDLIGEMGSSGHSTGPHLHFELRDPGGDSHEPFLGSCSETTRSRWVDQGTYDALPALTCDTSFAECAPVQTISCGSVVDGRNDMAGSQSEHQFYGCSEFVYSGSEVSFEVITDLDEPVTVDVTGVSADLDVYVLQTPACDTSGCLTYSDESQDSDESVTWTAEAGQSYTVVLDGWEGAATDFQLGVQCDGALPQPEDSGDPDDTDDPTDSDSDSDSDDGGGRVPNDELGGCSCASSGPAPFALLGLVLVLGFRREARRTPEKAARTS